MQKPVEILLVEDNPGDARLLEETFKEGKLINNMHHVKDGVEAVKYLRQQDPYKDAVRPDLILLDLNLPKMDGREVLADVKNDATLKRIPVVVLTVSKAEQDILKAYDLHANCYIAKPVNFDEFIKVVHSIEMFWLNIVKLPID